MQSRVANLTGRAVRTGLSKLYLVTVHNWRQGPRTRALQRLWASQWWSLDRLQAEQWRSLQQLLLHAYQHVPFYRKMFRGLGAEPQDVRTPDDFRRLPLLTKELIQTHPNELRAEGGFNPAGVYLNHTGGSTGAPLSFWQDAQYRSWGMAELDRDFRLCGYRPGQRQAFLWGSDVDSRFHQTSRGRIHDFLHNLQWIDTFDVDVGKLRRALQQLVVFDPHLLVGYVSSLALMARLVHAEGLVAPRPRAIQTSAEALTQSTREIIEGAFGAKCFDRYGCREVGNIAHECDAHRGLHLLLENNYTEFVTDDHRTADPGTTGQIVVTNLHNHVMPLIRYATGDVGTPSSRPCACGRGLPLMESVKGRISDTIVSPSGKLLHGEFFTHLFYGLDGVRQFQVEQMTTVDLVIRIVTESPESFESTERQVADLISRHGDPAFRIVFQRVTQIPPRKSGKYCFTLSHVPISFGGQSQDVMAR